MIRTRGLTKRYSDTAGVYDLELDIPGGSIFGFLGPNGAGKTTTIRMLTGLLKPGAGSAVVAGFDLATQPLEVKRRTGYCGEVPYLYTKLRGREFLAFVGDLYGVPPAVAKERGSRLLDLFEMTAKADDLIESYSHGMRRKIALAGALIHDPAVLFLDEPTNGLDPRSARRVKDLVVALAGEGKTIFLTTHILEIAQHMCTEIAIVDRGRLIAQGTIGELRSISAQRGSSGPRSLEDIFLELTGGPEVAAVTEFLAAGSCAPPPP
jgi:ABC-2 type transport system ATP-binding protein